MKTTSGDIFLLPAQAVCLPTHISGNRERMPMISGVLLRALILWPGLDYLIGQRIAAGGHRVHLLSTYATPLPTIVTNPRKGRSTQVQTPLPYHLVTFPARRSKRTSLLNMSLIKESCKQLMQGIEKMKWTVVHLPYLVESTNNMVPRPEVDRLLANSLDDRVVLVKPVRQEK